MEGNPRGLKGRGEDKRVSFYSFYKKRREEKVWHPYKKDKRWGQEEQTEEKIEGDIQKRKEMDGGWDRDSCDCWKGGIGKRLLGTQEGVSGSIKRKGILERSILNLVNLYQVFLSPYIPTRCRFYPSCSDYAKEAISRYGIWKGGWMSILRVLRCNPFNPGGYDPVRKT